MTTDGMRWLSVQHETVYAYAGKVELAHHIARLCPRTTATQAVRDWSLLIDPLPDEWLSFGFAQGERAAAKPQTQELAQRHRAALQAQLSHDCWGNGRVSFSHSRVHERLRVLARFEAGRLPAAAPDVEESPHWEAVAASLRYHAGAVRSEAVEFTLPSHFSPRDPSLAALGLEAFTPGRSVMGGALALMSLIHERFEYRPMSTSVNTLAIQALAKKQGVCQDFAHVMIGACRSLGLAARYVSGYLLTHPPKGQARLVGADASHAWVEVWCPAQGWVALDPTNNVLAGIDHVTLAWGRDYADVAPLRGVIRGGGQAEPQVAVTVEPLADAEASPGTGPAVESAEVQD